MLNTARKILNKTLFQYKAENRRAVIEINHYSLTIINSFLPLHPFIPFTSWAISPTGLLHMLNYISIYKPKVIVEFGMGISTLYISRLIEQNKLDSVLYCIDHDADWVKQMEIWLKAAGVEPYPHLIHAPLTEEGYSFRQRPIQWYDTRILDAQIPKEQVEFLVIDAPPHRLLYSRAGAFQYFSEQLAQGKANYFMDDANRQEEREILHHFGMNDTCFLDYAIGGKRPQPFDTTPVSLFK
jgi:hypothetical protein